MTSRFVGFGVLTMASVVAVSWAANSGSPSAQTTTPAVRTPQKQAAAASQLPPRTADGQVDIQGVWGNENTGAFTSSLEPRPYLAGLGAPKLTLLTTSPAGSERPIPKVPSILVDPPTGILPYQPWALERRNSVLKGYVRPQPWQLDSETLSWPGGVPRVHVYSSLNGSTGGPWQVLQGPGYVLFLFETQHEFRYVPVDGRVRPGADIKLWMGASRGHWEGHTLVIETTNNNDSPRLTIVGDFHSDAMRVTERFTYVDKDTLDYRATVDDPKVFTQPWTIAFTNKRAPLGTELIEYAGVEGEHSVEVLADELRREREARRPK